MTIGIDAGSLGINDERLKVGVYYMAKSMFEKIGKRDKTNRYLLYSFYPVNEKLLKSFGPNFTNIVVRPTRGWTKIWLPLRIFKDKPDIFVGLNQSLPLRLPLQTYKSIVIIHDLLFEQYPKLYPESFDKLHKETLSSSRKAEIIIVPSKATERDLMKLYKVPEKKISVIYEGIRSFPRGDQNTKYKIQDTKYFLYVGALKPQKNIPNLIKAFNFLISQYPNIYLFIVGGDKWKDKEIDKIMKSLHKKIQDRIYFLGVVDDYTLINLYKNALAFVCPSLSEGFGLAFLESISYGTPVIGPNKGAVPEVIGSAGILINPTNINQITKAMKKMLNPKTHAVFKKKTKKQANNFSWEKFAGEFLNIIKKLE